MSSPELDAYVDEGLRRASAKHYHPTVFVGMRTQRGTVEAISRLLISGEIQSGFRRMIEIGLVDYSLESTALRFPGEFSNPVLEAATWRLAQAEQTG